MLCHPGEKTKVIGIELALTASVSECRTCKLLQAPIPLWDGLTHIFKINKEIPNVSFEHVLTSSGFELASMLLLLRTVYPCGQLMPIVVTAEAGMIVFVDAVT